MYVAKLIKKILEKRIEKLFGNVPVWCYVNWKCIHVIASKMPKKRPKTISQKCVSLNTFSSTFIAI